VTGSTCPLSAHWVLWTGRSHEHLSGGSYPDCHCDHAHMRTAVRAPRLIPIILLGACKFMQRRGENGPGAIRALRDVSGVILPFRQPSRACLVYGRFVVPQLRTVPGGWQDFRE
jgi:hypothetical protein